MPDDLTRYEDDDPLDGPWCEEGDCPTCDGTGEVCCDCGGDCPNCIDGMRTCQGCGGSGFVDTPTEDES